MSTTTQVVLEKGGRQVLFTGPNADEVSNDPKFKDWFGFLPDDFGVQAVTNLGAVFIPSNAGAVMFFGLVKFKLEVLPYEVVGLIAGEAVGILIILEDEIGELWTILVKQIRPVIGKMAIELPAGRVSQSDEFEGRAAKALAAASREMGEETNLVLPVSELVSLGYYYSSPGMTDEVVRLFVNREPLRLTRDQILAMDGVTGGLQGEHESITIIVVRLLDLLLAGPESDGDAIIAEALCDAKLSIALDRYRRLHYFLKL